ncbi:ABC transporter substrate-binding protein [Leifsonia sp. LS1]|uniref:ABC transporter substrate-binding protein n=1 Tax=Leifsonia sp. LS1 TaxID=2828483 RepID=UPI001CFF276D|nr:extracellular solute-binding protein [Leifsonia sp. LS1]
MISRRTMIAVGALAAAALGLSGCAAGGTAESGGTQTVSLLVNVTPNLTEDWWNELVKPFEKAHPDIDVKIQNPGAEGVAAAVPRLLAAGEAPDVVESLPPSTELAPELVDLSTYKWATDGPLAEQYTIDGKYYMAGIGMQLQSLWFYNKDAFAAAGIAQTPTTVEELSDDLAKLKKAGWTGIQTGGDWMSSYALQTVGLPTVVAEHPDWYQKMSAGKLTFSTTYGASVDEYADWIKQGYVNDDALGIKYADAEQNFLAGKSALYPMGSWFVASEAAATSPANIGVFRAPAVDGVKQPAMGANIASPYVIMKDSKHVDAAAKLVEWLVTDKAAILDQLKVDGNYRAGYEYDTTALGTDLATIVADTPDDAYTPTGQGYGERTLPSGYSTEINAQTQALLGGTAPGDVNKAMDDWFSANLK